MSLLEHEFIAISKLYDKERELLTYVPEVHVWFLKKEIDLYFKNESKISQETQCLCFESAQSRKKEASSFRV